MEDATLQHGIVRGTCHLYRDGKDAADAERSVAVEYGTSKSQQLDGPPLGQARYQSGCSSGASAFMNRSEDNPVVCSGCFSDRGLRLDAERMGMELRVPIVAPAATKNWPSPDSEN